jgi:hypothetical protein
VIAKYRENFEGSCIGFDTIVNAPIVAKISSSSLKKMIPNLPMKMDWTPLKMIMLCLN